MKSSAFASSDSQNSWSTLRAAQSSLQNVHEATLERVNAFHERTTPSGRLKLPTVHDLPLAQQQLPQVSRQAPAQPEAALRPQPVTLSLAI